MKKMIFAAGALLALAGCNNSTVLEQVTPTQDSGMIEFRTNLDKATRAVEELNLDGLKTKGFSVYGYKSDDNSDLLGGKKDVTWTGGAWTYSPKVKWPETTPVNFFAYAPTQGWPAEAVYTEAAGNEKTIVVNNANATLSADILAAKATASVIDNIASLPFNHILSQVQFKFKNAEDADILMTVHSAALHNVKSNGTYTYSTDAWTNVAGEKTATILNDNAADLTTASGAEAVNMGENMMILPQSIEAWGGKPDGTATASTKGYLKFKATIKGKSGDNIVDKNGIAISNRDIYLPFNINFEKGKRYVITIIAGDKTTTGKGGGFDENGNPLMSNLYIEFNATVSDWVDATPAPEFKF